jgi:Arc/MetJ-type ribon-helix-helix transcriptional regulator
MNATLRPQFERFIDEQVKAGHFRSPAELIEAGIARLMVDPPVDELDDQDRAAIAESMSQMERGEVHDFKAIADTIRQKFL